MSLSDDQYTELALCFIHGTSPIFDATSIDWLRLATEIARLRAENK